MHASAYTQERSGALQLPEASQRSICPFSCMSDSMKSVLGTRRGECIGVLTTCQCDTTPSADLGHPSATYCNSLLILANNNSRLQAQRPTVHDSAPLSHVHASPGGAWCVVA